MTTAGAPKGPPGGSVDALGVDRAMLDQAIGGWRGMIDSGLPAAVFVQVIFWIRKIFTIRFWKIFDESTTNCRFCIRSRRWILNPWQRNG